MYRSLLTLQDTSTWNIYKVLLTVHCTCTPTGPSWVLLTLHSTRWPYFTIYFWFYRNWSIWIGICLCHKSLQENIEAIRIRFKALQLLEIRMHGWVSFYLRKTSLQFYNSHLVADTLDTLPNILDLGEGWDIAFLETEEEHDFVIEGQRETSGEGVYVIGGTPSHVPSDVNQGILYSDYSNKETGNIGFLCLKYVIVLQWLVNIKEWKLKRTRRLIVDSWETFNY